jgi:hypothetical protein
MRSLSRILLPFVAGAVVLRVPGQLRKVSRAAVVSWEHDLGPSACFYVVAEWLVFAAGAGTRDSMF